MNSSECRQIDTSNLYSTIGLPTPGLTNIGQSSCSWFNEYSLSRSIRCDETQLKVANTMSAGQALTQFADNGFTDYCFDKGDSRLRVLSKRFAPWQSSWDSFGDSPEFDYQLLGMARARVLKPQIQLVNAISNSKRISGIGLSVTYFDMIQYVEIIPPGRSDFLTNDLREIATITVDVFDENGKGETSLLTASLDQPLEFLSDFVAEQYFALAAELKRQVYPVSEGFNRVLIMPSASEFVHELIGHALESPKS